MYKNHLVGQIVYIIPNPVKKRRQKQNLVEAMLVMQLTRKPSGIRNWTNLNFLDISGSLPLLRLIWRWPWEEFTMMTNTSLPAREDSQCFILKFAMKTENWTEFRSENSTKKFIKILQNWTKIFKKFYKILLKNDAVCKRVDIFRTTSFIPF